MKRCALIAIVLTLVICAAGSGCARAARDTSSFALRDETVVNASFDETWHAVKQVLREQEYEIYTRDKRGVFIAYTPMKRVLWVQPRRTKFTIELARIASEETAIGIESVRQVYGVTLLTHPNWHDREQRDPQASRIIIEAVQSIIAGGGVVPEAPITESDVPENTPETETPVIEEAEAVN
ncbi:MAG: hypothetical protein KAH38_02865 [Candidatus Hydrogenedentes bacterium]|nr:hypothetical protein [Candidatus Hydrogenedentota bacterium]